MDDEPGIPRYENDPYRRSDPSVNGNWWFITTLWHAQYLLEKGHTEDAQFILDWTLRHSLSTGMLSEQINPINDEVIAPAPLTWSHAEYVSTVLDLIQKKKS
jgi:GH15 family glucan-1,4-alpha-glucosidase